jgi:hypothetical protein
VVFGGEKVVGKFTISFGKKSFVLHAWRCVRVCDSKTEKKQQKNSTANGNPPQKKYISKNIPNLIQRAPRSYRIGRIEDIVVVVVANSYC